MIFFVDFPTARFISFSLPRIIKNLWFSEFFVNFSSALHCANTAHQHWRHHVSNSQHSNCLQQCKSVRCPDLASWQFLRVAWLMLRNGHRLKTWPVSLRRTLKPASPNAPGDSCERAFVAQTQSVSIFQTPMWSYLSSSSILMILARIRHFSAQFRELSCSIGTTCLVLSQAIKCQSCRPSLSGRPIASWKHISDKLAHCFEAISEREIPISQFSADYPSHAGPWTFKWPLAWALVKDGTSRFDLAFN